MLKPGRRSRRAGLGGARVPGRKGGARFGLLLLGLAGLGALVLPAAAGAQQVSSTQAAAPQAQAAAQGAAQAQGAGTQAATGTGRTRALAVEGEQVEVTAYRTPLATLDSPVSTRMLDAAALEHAAAVTLDGKLRLVPGFELFRRTSALVANPTTQGLSLRGLGSTAASRTLVVSDDVPLNDPYGGWIHWNELPSLAVERVEVVRGGASDLYGSSAIGGVVNVMTVRPGSRVGMAGQAAGASGAQPLHGTVESGYGAEGTTENGAEGNAVRGRWGGVAAAGLTATDGYTLVAPGARGPVDTRSNVHAENGLVELDRLLGEAKSSRVFVRGNVLNENRHNGTPLQVNATRLWRYAAGADLGRLSARGFGSNEHYYQSYSSIAAGRVAETRTRTGEDPADELGATVRWTQPLGAEALLVAGGDVRDVRAEDITFSPAGAVTTATARQRQTGGYAEGLATPGNWTLSASARVDHFTNTDAGRYAPSGATAQPTLSETVVDPRLGVSWRVRPRLALSGSGFRAYRAPTENELYRVGQVGQQTTLANPLLKSERATGWETGAATAGKLGELRGSYFWTQVNRPITALTLSTTATATTLMRENLGRIESRGVSLDGSVHPAVTFPAALGADTHLSFQGGYQFARATVTSYAQQPALVGNWIPQVARHAATLQATLSGERVGVVSLQARASGRQYDDDQNRYELHSYVRFDVYASHALGRGGWGSRVDLFAAVENLLDRSIDAGRTPVRTLGTPQLARFGMRVRLGE